MKDLYSAMQSVRRKENKRQQCTIKQKATIDQRKRWQTVSVLTNKYIHQ